MRTSHENTADGYENEADDDITSEPVFRFLIVDNYVLVFRVVNIVLYVFCMLVCASFSRHEMGKVCGCRVRTRLRSGYNMTSKRHGFALFFIVYNYALVFRVINRSLYVFR